MTTPSVPGGAVKEASLTSAAFSPKMARKSRSSGASSVSDFGVILPTKNIAWLDFSTDANNPVFAEICKSLFRDVWNIFCDLFLTEFCISRRQLKFFK